MAFPTSVPNETARNIVHPNRRDNNWGDAVNADLYELASKADQYRDTVRADVIELERRVATQFQSLIDFINGNVADYGFQMAATRLNIINVIKDYLQTKMAAVVGELIDSTKGSLAAINEMEETLLLQINKIQTEFNLFEGQIISETDRTLAIVDSETRETNSVKEEIIQRVKTIRSKLATHVSDRNNPHETDASKLSGDSVFYQPDPIGTDAIQPHDPFDVVDVNTPTDSELEDLAASEFSPIGETEASTLSTLWRNLLAKYIVFDGTSLNSPGFYFRLGGAAGYANNGIETIKAIDPGGDFLIIDDGTGNPNELRLTWDVSAKNHQPGDFIVLDFGNTDPIEGGNVTIEFYPEGGVLGSPASIVIETITRLRFLNAPQIVNQIFSHEAASVVNPDPEINMQAAVLKYYSESSASNVIPILGWTPDKTLGFDVWELDLLINSNVETPIEPLFEIPRRVLAQIQSIPGFESIKTWPSGYFNATIGVRKFVGFADPADENSYIIVSKPNETGDYNKLTITVASELTPIIHDEILTVNKELQNELTATTKKSVNGFIKTYEPPYVAPSSSS